MKEKAFIWILSLNEILLLLCKFCSWIRCFNSLIFALLTTCWNLLANMLLTIGCCRGLVMNNLSLQGIVEDWFCVRVRWYKGKFLANLYNFLATSKPLSLLFRKGSLFVALIRIIYYQLIFCRLFSPVIILENHMLKLV